MMAANALTPSGASMAFKGFLLDSDLTIDSATDTVSAKGVPIDETRLLEKFLTEQIADSPFLVVGVNITSSVENPQNFLNADLGTFSCSKWQIPVSVYLLETSNGDIKYILGAQLARDTYPTSQDILSELQKNAVFTMVINI